VPNVSRIALLGNPDTETYSSVLKSARAAAQKAGLLVVPIEARNPQEIENAFSALDKEHVPGPQGRQPREALQPAGQWLIVEALARLRPRSCVIDGEAVACGEDGIASFDRVRYRRHDGGVLR
jgi:ATP-dependent DNA ligase